VRLCPIGPAWSNASNRVEVVLHTTRTTGEHDLLDSDDYSVPGGLSAATSGCGEQLQPSGSATIPSPEATGCKPLGTASSTRFCASRVLNPRLGLKGDRRPHGIQGGFEWAASLDLPVCL